MEGDKNKWGFIVLLRNGRTSPPYELDVGKHNIGSAADSNIRLRSLNTSLLSTHAVITVNKLGVAIITNKSAAVPISVNGKNVFKTAVLHDGDKFTVVDKEFQYTNENLKDIPEDSDIFQQAVAKSIKRTSVAPKTPVFKTNTPLKSTPLNQHVQSSTRKSVTNIGHCKTVSSQVRKSLPLTSSAKRKVSLQTKRLVVESITEEEVNKKLSAKSPRTSSRLVKPFELQENNLSQALDPANTLNITEDNDNRTDLEPSSSLLAESDDDFYLHLSDNEPEPPLYEPTSVFNESTQDKNYNLSHDSSIVVVIEEKRRSSRRSVFEETIKNCKSENVSQAALDESTKQFNITESPGIDKRFSNQNISRASRRSGILSPIEISSTQESSQDTSLASNSSSRSRSQNSSLNSSVSSHIESASPLKSISSQSFSSYKKVSTKTGDTVSETTEIDVVNITSTSHYTPENRKSGSRLKMSSTGKRVSTSMPDDERMFDKLLCTSTPFHKEPLNVSLDEKMSISDSVTAPKASPPKRRSSLRSSVTKRKHRCFSCGPEMSKSVSVLHRQSSDINVTDATPEKSFKEETPKSHIKSVRRSSKANQSTYNPLVEDVTPVTPENMQISNLNEEAFKTPINTPGLFESITKSVIRSKKRLRESYGSTTKASKKPKVEEAAVPLQPKNQQKSPANRLSDFDGVKKLMKSPAKSPKNDLTKVPNLRKLMSPKVQKSPVNDLSRNVSGAANLFNVSGIEMLHDGSDIENSEDLFTNLTGKQPVRSYGSRKIRSLTGKKDGESFKENDKSRKTMGDLPLCSPRVAQWVEEHVNLSAQGVKDGDDSFDEQLFERSDRTSRRGRSRSIARNKSLNDEVEPLYNTSRRRSERISGSNNSLVKSMKKYEGEQPENVSADYESVDVNSSHLKKSSRKSKTRVFDKSLKTPEPNQEESFQNNTKSPSLKSELCKTTGSAETLDRKPRVTKGISSKKKTSLTSLKRLTTEDSFDKISTSFDADQQSSVQSSFKDSLVDASDVVNNLRNEHIKVKNELIEDNKLKSRRVAYSVSPKKHRVGHASGRRRTVAEYPQSTADTNQKRNDDSVVLENTSIKTSEMQTPDRRNLRSFSPKKKSLLGSATSRRTTVERSGESSFRNTHSARNSHENIENQQSSPNDSFDDENTVANNYIESSHEDVNCAGPSTKIEPHMADTSIDDFELLDRAKRNQTVKKTCFSVSPKKRSLKDSSNRRKTVAEYPQSVASFDYSDNKIESDLFEDGGIHQQNMDDGELLGRRSLKLTDADLKTPVKKPKSTRTVSLKKPTPLRTSKGRRRTVGDFGDVSFQKFQNANTNNQQSAVECSIEDNLVDDSVTSELHNMNNSQNSKELKSNLSDDDDLFANVYDNNVIKNKRMCHSVSPQKDLRDSTNRRKTVAQYSQLSAGLDQSHASETYVNENSDSCHPESDYSDLMANVSLDKPLRRRKGLSLNTLKATVSFNSRRKTLGAQTKTTPKVKSWKHLYRFTQQSKDVPPLSRRATSNFASISLPSSLKRRRSFADLNSKKIVPKVDDWKTETVSITPSTTMLNTSSEKPKSASVATSRKIENKVPVKLDPNQLDLESEEAGSTKILNKPVEVLKRTTRKRAVSKEEILELVEEPPKITPKRNTRRAKINQKPDGNDEVMIPRENASDVKSNQNNNTSENILATQKPKKLVGTRKGRGKNIVSENEQQLVADQTKINTSTNINGESPRVIEQLITQDEKETKIQKNLAEMQSPVKNSVGLTEKKTRKRNLSKEDVQEIDDQVKVSSTEVPTRETKKRKLNENIVEEALSDLETKENMKSTRGKTKSEPVKGRRGRSNKINSEAVKVEADKTEPYSVCENEKYETEALIPGSVKPKRPTRGRKAVVEKTAESPISAEAPVAIIVLEPVKAKPKRGRKVVTENIAVPAEGAVAEIELERVKPKRATRQRKADLENIAETPVPVEESLEPVKPKILTRGRKAVPKNIAETVVPAEEPLPSIEDLEPVQPKKVMRGRKAVLENIETSAEDLKEDQAPIIPKKTTRGKKALAEDKAPLAEDPVAVEDGKLNKTKKTARGKKTDSENSAETVNQVSSVESEVQPKRSARGRKAIQADASAIAEEPVSADEPIAAPKVGKSTRSKRGQEDNTQPDEIEMKENNVAGRPNRRGERVNYRESTDPPVKQTRSRRGKKNEMPQNETESEDIEEVVSLNSRKANSSSEAFEKKERQVTFNEQIGVKFMTPRPGQRKLRGNRRNIEYEEASDKEFDDVVFNKPVRATKRSRRQ